ncbi:UNVERIFIED_CONTAM: putative pentatricopeptide repeat-containing protein [Sesamum calycinum]|uniref:Pentatricopeptide repeat-containing protein n=1 Tax=Sesamum calycinum TaxID=2727403 RepID=A0AAW2SCX6_9LAMI
MRPPKIRTPNPISNLRPTAQSRRPKDDDENFLAMLNDVVRSKQSWTISLDNPSISTRLRPLHIEKFILQNVQHSRLALRFFNFLGLHKNFRHSTASFCLLVHSLVQSKLYWPASSLLQTLLERKEDPSFVFRIFCDSYKRCDFCSAYGFDLLVQSYVQSRRVLDSVLVVKSMKECGLFPEVRTLSAVLNGLIRIRKFDMVLGLFDEMFVRSGLQPDVYVYTAVIRSLCELQDYDRAKEMVSWVEKNGWCKLNVVTYNVLIHGLCKSGRVWEAVEIKKMLAPKALRADVVTYCTLVLGLCKVDEFGIARDLVDEMVEYGIVPSEEALSSVVDGMRRKGEVDEKLEEAELLFAKMEEKGLLINDVTYNIIINSFCKRGNLDEAIIFLGKMLSAGIKPTVYPYNMLISGQCKLGKLSAAEKLCIEMNEKG